MNDENFPNTIALLTDFGARDYFVGAMNGAILSVCARALIVDITHEIEPQNIRAASFTLRACYENFPAKTVFVAVVDPGVGSNRRAVVVEANDYFFVAPDNGLLSFVFDANENSNATSSPRVFEITNEKYLAKNVSRTFHGRDIFAPVAAHLANGVAPEAFGAQIFDFVRVRENRPQQISDERIEAEIIHVDRFGNLITNLKREHLPEKFYLKCGEKRVERLLDFFAEAETGEIFMIFGSAGFLEIAAFGRSAKNILNVEAGAKIIAQST